MLADLKIEYVTQKLVSVNVVHMSWERSVIDANRDIGTWTQKEDVRNVFVILMEVNITHVTFIPVNVYAKMALKVPNVINVKSAILDSRRVDAKVSQSENFISIRH
jgi:hypothetical protein